MSLDKLTIKEIRGQILRLLYDQQMAELSETTVRRALYTMGFSMDEKQLHGEINYLQEKGYLSARIIKTQTLYTKIRIRMMKITPKGKDLLEGTPPEGDPGIAIDLE